MMMMMKKKFTALCTHVVVKYTPTRLVVKDKLLAALTTRQHKQNGRSREVRGRETRAERRERRRRRKGRKRRERDREKNVISNTLCRRTFLFDCQSRINFSRHFCARVNLDNDNIL
jgi:hypothetical protein